MTGHAAPVVTGKRQGDDGGKRDADFSAGMSEAKPQEPGNDNQPFDEKKWRKDYMREYMRKKRERLRAAKAKPTAD
jgi:hypothetical protein